MLTITHADLPPMPPNQTVYVAATMSPGRIVALYVNGKRQD